MPPPAPTVVLPPTAAGTDSGAASAPDSTLESNSVFFVIATPVSRRLRYSGSRSLSSASIGEATNSDE